MNSPLVEFTCGENEVSEQDVEKFLLPYGKAEETDGMRASLISLRPDTIQKKIAYVTAVVSYENGAEISAGEEKIVSLRLVNNVKAYGNQPYNVRVKVWLPDGFTADKTEFDVFAPHWTPFTLDCTSEEVKIVIKAGEDLPSVSKVLLEIGAVGRYTEGFVPVVFVRK